MTQVNIYVLSTIKGVGKKKGKYIYLLETETSKGIATIHKVVEVEPMTKDVAELTAICAAVSRLKDKPCELNIYVTSQQLANNINHFLRRWARNNFCKADGHRLAYWQLWELLYKKTTLFDYRAYFKTHSYSKWLEKELQQEKSCVARGD